MPHLLEATGETEPPAQVEAGLFPLVGKKQMRKPKDNKL